MIAPPRAQIPQLAKLHLELKATTLRLRPIAETDVELMWPTVSLPDFPHHMSWEAHRDRDETLAFVRAMTAATAAGTDVVWAIFDGERFVGSIGLHGITWSAKAWRRDRAELGYWIAPGYQKRGFATEAAHAVLEFAFEVLGLHKVTVGCIAENVASKRVIEKCGFRYVAKIDEDVHRHGRWWSHLRYELTFNEWSDVSTTMRISRPRPRS